MIEVAVRGQSLEAFECVGFDQSALAKQVVGVGS